MNKHIGSDLRSLFEELGEAADLDLMTRKKVLAEQIRARMTLMKVTPGKLATAMKTSRTVVYRLLDPSDTGVTLDTLVRASKALGLELLVSFEKAKPAPKRAPVKTAAMRNARPPRRSLSAMAGR